MKEHPEWGEATRPWSIGGTYYLAAAGAKTIGDPGYLEPAHNGEPYCDAKHDGWPCTRAAGHGGPHAAHVRVQVASWEEA